MVGIYYFLFVFCSSLYYSAYIDIFQNLIGSKDALGIWWFQKYPKIQHFCDEYLWRYLLAKNKPETSIIMFVLGFFFLAKLDEKWNLAQTKRHI